MNGTLRLAIEVTCAKNDNPKYYCTEGKDDFIGMVFAHYELFDEINKRWKKDIS